MREQGFGQCRFESASVQHWQAEQIGLDDRLMVCVFMVEDIAQPAHVDTLVTGSASVEMALFINIRRSDPKVVQPGPLLGFDDPTPCHDGTRTERLGAGSRCSIERDQKADLGGCRRRHSGFHPMEPATTASGIIP